jgi:uncharacterized membrane protein YedE/YeeE
LTRTDVTIAWTSFTPWASLAGGLLVGLAVALLILFNGRIAGISGIVGGMLAPARGDIGWRAAFVLGLLAAPLAWLALAAARPLHIDAGLPTLVAAGLLVGVGTRVGSGCTSGHGVCGISRGSARSFAATALFMAAGFVVVFVMRHLLAH